MESNIHFIVGIWRSGTTLLREVLGMSDSIKIFPEHFVLLQHLKKAKHFNQAFLAQLFEDVKQNPDFLHFAKPDLEQLKTKLFQSNTFNEAIQHIYSSCLTEEETTVQTFIDKNPIYSYYLPELMEQFPEAKFIWMVREPKDNCISRAKHDIQSFKNYTYLANWWSMTNEKIAKQAQKNPDRFLLVSYDDMVKNPEPWVKQICNFTNVAFDEKMLAFETKKEKRLTDFVMAAKARDGKITKEYARKKKAMWKNLQKPINTSKTKQWEKELTSQQIQSVNYYSADYYQSLLLHDYTATTKKHFIYSNLAKLSLAKLKYDISTKALS